MGTVKSATLALALRGFGLTVERHDGFLEVDAGEDTPPVAETLERMAAGEEVNLFAGGEKLLFEKFHPYLSPELLAQNALSSRLDPAAVSGRCKQVTTAS